MIQGQSVLKIDIMASNTSSTPRIHLLAAREAPVVMILQRKRNRVFHVVTARSTETHAIDEGSWFRGMLYPMDCDVSFDGKFMVYRATGADDQMWSGVCRLPWLKTLVHVEEPITGGGYFSGPNDLKTHGWDHSEKIFSERRHSFHDRARPSAI